MNFFRAWTPRQVNHQKRFPKLLGHFQGQSGSPFGSPSREDQGSVRILHVQPRPNRVIRGGRLLQRIGVRTPSIFFPGNLSLTGSHAWHRLFIRRFRRETMNKDPTTRKGFSPSMLKKIARRIASALQSSSASKAISFLLLSPSIFSGLEQTFFLVSD